MSEISRSQLNVMRHVAMNNLIEQLHDPRFRDTILRAYPDTIITYMGPVHVTEQMRRYATICINHTTHAIHLSHRSTDEPEISEGWELVAVYDLHTNDLVGGTAFDERA